MTYSVTAPNWLNFNSDNYPARGGNHQWALDFMHDTLYCGKRFRTLYVEDEAKRECLAIEIDTSLPAGRVVRALEHLKEERGLPKQLRVDNGPEFISAQLTGWCKTHNIELVYIEPGKPQQKRLSGTLQRLIPPRVPGCLSFRVS